MSHQDNIEASQSLIDTLQTCETQSLSSMCSESPDIEGVLKFSTPLPDLPNVSESAEYTVLTSGTLDPNNHVVLVEEPHSRVEAKSLDLSQDNLASPCRVSDSETPSTATIAESPDFEGVFKCSTPLPDLLNVSESAEDTVSTCGALDPNNHVVLVDESHPRVEAKSLVLSQDNLASPCRVSDSETSSTATRYSSDWSFSSEIPSCGILGRCYKEYTYYLRTFRDNGYLLPFDVICLAFTVGCCFMGAYNWPLCPADVNIPRYVFFNGALATFSVCMEIVFALSKLLVGQHYRATTRIYYCAFCFGWVALTMTLVEMVEFYTMSYSFHRVEENYCNKVFYWFVHYKNIAFGVVMALTAVIYIPGRETYWTIDGRLSSIN